MTPDMAEIILSAAIRVANAMQEAEHAAVILFIVMVMIVGSVWAFSLVTTSWMFERARLIFKNA